MQVSKMTMQTGDIRLIKTINHGLVMNLIRKHEVISGAQLAQITGMRPSTISNLLKDLLAKSLIRSQGKGDSTERGGKKPNLWSLNTQVAYAIGIDVEVNEITATVMDIAGKCVHQQIAPVEGGIRQDNLIPTLTEAIDDIISQTRIDNKILGMGVSLAGVVQAEEGVILMSRILPNLDIPIKANLAETYSFPILVENNANTAAIGEKWVGNAIDCRNFMIVLIEVDRFVGGLGIGLMLDDKLYHGATYAAGELNIAIPNLTETLRSLRSRFQHGSVLHQYAENIDVVDIDLLIQAAQDGDEVARTYFSMLGHLIGKTIAPSVGLINPEKVILAGHVAEMGDLLVRPVHEAIQMETLSISNEHLEVVTSKHGHYAVATGAAAMILNEFFKVPIIHTDNKVTI